MLYVIVESAVWSFGKQAANSELSSAWLAVERLSTKTYKLEQTCLRKSRCHLHGCILQIYMCVVHRRVVDATRV